MSEDDDLFIDRLRPAKGIDARKPTPVPEPDNSDIDLLMWRGPVEIHKQRVPPEPTPAVRTPREVPVTTELPTTGPVRPDTWWMQWNVFPVYWEEPTVWSEPYDVDQTANVPFYEQAVPIFQFQVPYQYFLVVQGISYEVDGVAANEFFDVELLRGEQRIASWQEFVIDAAATNPGERYAWAGHSRPMPFQVRFDQNNHLTVRITYRGTKPFNKTPIDPLNRDIKVIVSGYLLRMRDGREGAPKYLVDPLNDYVVDAHQNLWRDLPHMAKFMVTIAKRLEAKEDDDD